MMMKKKYKKPHIWLLLTKWHLYTWSPYKAEYMDQSRRSFIMRDGLRANVGYMTLNT